MYYRDDKILNAGCAVDTVISNVVFIVSIYVDVKVDDLVTFKGKILGFL